MRNVYCILSPRSWPYARYAVESLFAKVQEPIRLTLLTDSPEDGRRLRDLVAVVPNPRNVVWQVCDDADAGVRAADHFGRWPNLLRFRQGHPCWRKITDPLLYAASGEEMIILDPDLYFPNRFAFEDTPAAGVALMWQPPNCLFPPSVVERAFHLEIPLAHHVDIGVAHWRGGVDFDWFDALVAKLGGAELPRLMHIEAVVWAAIALRIGGGYLDPRAWVCWRRTQWKRLRLKLGAAGASILRAENLAGAKCFHAGGEAKNWIAPGLLDRQDEVGRPTALLPFVRLSRAEFVREQRLKRLARSLGYYRVFGGSNA